MSEILWKTRPRFATRLVYALRPIGILTLWLALVAGSVCSLGAEPAKGPLRVHPDNPRYFTDGSRAVYLTGSHTWSNLVDMTPGPTPAAFGYSAFLDWTQRYGHNFIRMWAWELLNWDTAGNSPSYSKNTVLSVAPHPWQRTGPGAAFDGKPKFDLGKFNPKYFRRLRSRIEAAGKRGIYVSVMLFEGWGIRKAPGAWENHPFHPGNNINGLEGDANGDANRDGKAIEIHTLAVPAVTAVQEAYVREVINTVNHFDNVLYEIVNEAHPSSTQWQHQMIRFVQDYERGKPKQHPVGMTAQRPKTSDRPLFEGPADWVSPDGNAGASPEVNPAAIKPGAWISPVGPRGAPTAYAGNKVVLSDTDHLGEFGATRIGCGRPFSAE
jgi:hypothetical protein